MTIIWGGTLAVDLSVISKNTCMTKWLKRLKEIDDAPIVVLKV